MLDMRPHLGVDADFIKYYYSSKYDRLRVSKDQMANIGIDDYALDHCRETIARRIFRAMEDHSYNPTNEERPYKLVPRPSIRIKGKLLYCNSIIYLKTVDECTSDYFSNKSNQKALTTALKYIVGILGVCLSSGVDERRRIATLSSSSRVQEVDDELITSYLFKYKDLSSFWLVSPPMYSLIIGLARNTFSIVYNDIDGLKENVLDKVSLKVVRDTINNSDRSKAIDIFYNYTIPYFESWDMETSGYVLAGRKKHQTKILKDLISAGCSNVFIPERTSEYWHSLDRYFGFDVFVSTATNSSFGLEYFRGI